MSAANLTLNELRNRTLVCLDETTSSSHYGTYIDGFLNDGLFEMVGLSSDGIEDILIIPTVVGVRAYTLPVGFIRPKQAMYNGFPIQHIQLMAQDFFSGGNSFIDRYSIWGAGGQKKIILGPLPPSQVYDLTIYYYREPTVLTDDNQVPEIPNRFRHFLPYYAASQCLLIDGDKDEASAFMEMFKKGCKEYNEWILFQSRQNYMSVIREVDYG